MPSMNRLHELASVSYSNAKHVILIELILRKLSGLLPACLVVSVQYLKNKTSITSIPFGPGGLCGPLAPWRP